MYIEVVMEISSSIAPESHDIAAKRKKLEEKLGKERTKFSPEAKELAIKTLHQQIGRRSDFNIKNYKREFTFFNKGQTPKTEASDSVNRLYNKIKNQN